MKVLFPGVIDIVLFETEVPFKKADLFFTIVIPFCVNYLYLKIHYIQFKINMVN